MKLIPSNFQYISAYFSYMHVDSKRLWQR